MIDANATELTAALTGQVVGWPAPSTQGQESTAKCAIGEYLDHDRRWYTPASSRLRASRQKRNATAARMTPSPRIKTDTAIGC